MIRNSNRSWFKPDSTSSLSLVKREKYKEIQATSNVFLVTASSVYASPKSSSTPEQITPKVSPTKQSSLTRRILLPVRIGVKIVGKVDIPENIAAQPNTGINQAIGTASSFNRREKNDSKPSFHERCPSLLP